MGRCRHLQSLGHRAGISSGMRHGWRAAIALQTASSFTQLLVVSVIVAAADIAFKAASGACLKGHVHRGGV
jgi:hypothetical protein